MDKAIQGGVQLPGDLIELSVSWMSWNSLPAAQV